MATIPSHESQTVEFKREWNEHKDGEPIKKTLVAFANTVGGDLYIGVDDDGTVVGLDDPSSIEEKLASTVRDNISPSIVGCFASEQMTVEGKTVLRVHVDAGPMKPYCLDPKTASGIYIRVGNTSSKASLDDIARMVRASNPIPYEDRAAFEQDLTFDYCMAFCHKHEINFDPKKNLTYGFWNAKWQAYTNLAAICSDQSTVRCVMINFADDERTTLLASEDVTGSIFKIFDRATEFLARSNYAWMEKPRNTPNPLRVDHYFIDPRVIMEALVNMLAHRDYSVTPANLIHVTPSAIKIFTVGGLVEGLSIKSVVEQMATECRNKKLAHLLQKMHLMENRGSGFDLIRRYYPTTPLESLLSVDDSSFTIRLPRNQTLPFANNEHYTRVLELLSRKAPVSRIEIQKHLGVSQTSAVNLIKNMLENGILEKTAEGRSTKYRVKGLG